MFQQISIIPSYFQTAFQSNPSLKSFKPFSDFINHILNVKGLESCYQKGIDIGRIFARFLSNLHSISISYFDSSQSEGDFNFFHT
jgi:hypothetical protein